MKAKKTVVLIKDSFGDVIYRAYVNSESSGLVGANLEALVAPFAQLQGQNLTGASLYRALLANADLSFANFSGAKMRGVILRDAVCRFTNFGEADLGSGELGAISDLCGADLFGADLRGTNVCNALYNARTKFPEGFDPDARGMVLQELDS